MAEQEADSFKYLAFDDVSRGLLAHGRTATIAVQAAEGIAPQASIRVLLASPFGRTIWDRGVELYLAERALRRAWDILEQLLLRKHMSKAERNLH
jgi:hypothetical protein